MLLVHQEGVVKVGEVNRFLLTYTPSKDKILPSPSTLFVRIKNTSAVPYRLGYLVGPYSLHVSAYPSTFNPYKKAENLRRDGIPQFEPQLKAGGHWHARLTVPDDIQERGDRAQRDEHETGRSNSVTWIIEVASQILFSNSASVQYELLVARDERSLDTGFAALASKGHGEPGRAGDLVQYQLNVEDRHPVPKGVYSKAIMITVQDAKQLWSTPAIPTWDDVNASSKSGKRSYDPDSETADTSENVEVKGEKSPDKRKKLHLVLLTHGLHSNVSADLLFLKESIDATAKQAREEAKERRAKLRKRDEDAQREKQSLKPTDQPSAQTENQDTSTAPLSGGQEDIEEDEFDPDDEQVIVRGFSGNVVRTEKGIQYLGKRLAKYILTVTYPDQPYLPEAKSLTRTFTGAFSNNGARQGRAAHAGSTIHKASNPDEKLPYTFTSISFIGHSLGGLVQLYAIGYIQKHSPQFFQQIKPQNFITMAAPLLGLSNENPMYVKFALDFGLVGRTGQDLGLTWRAPTIARNGWSTMMSGFGASEKEEQPKKEDPRAKPLLRILPSGPAHQVLRMFKNRTVYSNVVNDGIVPLRTSCLLFLDWRGLGRVENARRANGLIGSMAQFGWAELTGANTSSHRPKSSRSTMTDDLQYSDDEMLATPVETPKSGRKPSMRHSPPKEDESTVTPSEPSPNQFLGEPPHIDTSYVGAVASSVDENSVRKAENTFNPWGDFLNFFRPKPEKSASPTRPRGASKKSTRAIKRAQVVLQDKDKMINSSPEATDDGTEPVQKLAMRPAATRGDSVISNNDVNSGGPPPKTSIFEAAGDILNPPIPTQQWLTDPSSRSRTIFHDRIYHPEDIPAPPQKRSRMSLSSSFSSDSFTSPSQQESSPTSDSTLASNDERNRTEKELGTNVDASGMRVEEKIARAYHRDLSWRKVLVRLEPDAHNNMIVRRMFANAYGWDVVRHLCDTHFSNSYAAVTSDTEEDGGERASAPNLPVGENGDVVAGQGVSGEGSNKDKKGSVPGDDGGVPGAEEAELSASKHGRTISEMREATDEVKDLPAPHAVKRGSSIKKPVHRDSMAWSDSVFEGTDDEWEDQ